MRSFPLLLCAGLLVTLLACGGTTRSSTPPTPSPTPSPAPGGTPSNSGAFQAIMLNPTGQSTGGQVTVDATANNGSVALQLKGLQSMTSYAVNFCPFPGGESNGCFQITTFTADTSGNASASFTFPRVGNWAGVFTVTHNGTIEQASGFTYSVTTTDWRAALQRVSTITGGIGPNYQVGTDPLSSGSVSVAGSTATVQIQGAVPSSTYSVTFCANSGGSSCYNVGPVTTDGAGKGSATFNLLQTAVGNFTPPGIFNVGRTTPTSTGGSTGGIQFITGFVVP